MTNKTILTELQADYERQRMLNVQEQQRRSRAAQEKCPEIGLLMRDRQELIFSGMRGILSGKAQYDGLPARMELLNGRVASLLTQNGFPEDWLDPVYRCAACKDTGYVGEPVREMCDCLRGAYFKRLYRQVGLHDAENQSFERFDLKLFPDTPLPGKDFSQRQMMRIARNQCRDWAEQYPHTPIRNIVMSGKSGLGKTYLLHCMAKRLLDRGLNVMLISAFRFMELARKAHFSGSYAELEPLVQADVLMLDDLGSEPLMENITIVQLFNLINERQNDDRAIVISTNLPEKELQERYTERVASRLFHKQRSLFIPFEGNDVRLK